MLTACSVSTDGRYVAFASEANNLVAGDTNGCRDIFVCDLLLGTNILVSVATNGAGADNLSTEPAISGNGRYVAFTSSADNLVTGDTNKARDVVVRDLQAGTNILVSVNSSARLGQWRFLFAGDQQRRTLRPVPEPGHVTWPPGPSAAAMTTCSCAIFRPARTTP